MPLKRSHAVVAPLLVRADDHLRVGLRAEAVAAALELAAQLAVVVDLAVVHELQRAVVARERLHPRVAQVDDREPAEAERDAVVGERAVAVGAAVVERRGHRAPRSRSRAAARGDDHAAEAAHTRSIVGPAKGCRFVQRRLRAKRRVDPVEGSRGRPAACLRRSERPDPPLDGVGAVKCPAAGRRTPGWWHDPANVMPGTCVGPERSSARGLDRRER